MYDYDRRASKFDFTLSVSQKQAAVGLTALSPLAKLFVDGQQLGLISSIEVKITSASALPQRFRVGVLEGMRQEAFDASSERVRRTARTVVAELRRFPVIEVVCPEYL